MKQSNPSFDHEFETEEGIDYSFHSMMHKAILDMEPTKLEMLDGFESTGDGYEFLPDNSNVKIRVTGRDWSEKRVLIFGSSSTEEAEKYVLDIISYLKDIGRRVELKNDVEITNIVVSGNIGQNLILEEISLRFKEMGLNIEYEPEQFPAAILKYSDPRVTFLLFSTGKFVIQALRNFEDVEPAITRLINHLKDISHY